MKYLALGDSYTYGEQVRIIGNFPYQLVREFRMNGLQFCAPEIIAKTGWTTTDLLKAIEEYPILENYDFATLLIGVNNQYQNLPFELFQSEFPTLLRYAMSKVGVNGNLVVLNIPDWSVTPFAQEKDTKSIRMELGNYNSFITDICRQNHIACVDIYEMTTSRGDDPLYLAPDGLHPSELEYSEWVQKILTLKLNHMLINLSKKS